MCVSLCFSRSKKLLQKVCNFTTSRGWQFHPEIAKKRSLKFWADWSWTMECPMWVSSLREKNYQLGLVEYSHSSSCSQNWKKDIGAVTRHSYFCNWGYVLHPAVFDGTIHSLGTASVGKNVNDLKIFGGVGRVSIIQSENFSQHEPWLQSLHHCVTDQVEWAIECNRMNYLSRYFLWFSCMCCYC